ncbi:DUF4349 domain-containing protein [Micromonospora terminaliae]|uniref:DUF4349 domain-containing protein n=1 Tax=Micromonospora terminaliae TaxID=1914461 RepID=A0AAJ3DHI1_9ACTN|nr:DUF4349 domain-containing protein [Micromonospora terminaliae]NES26644.1 DUF4349 domain-containing protein [Micromonospora terminaliae]QGL50807.1 DUF4349 domain-containing protein [Micromonospora terminaliae]
MRIRDSRRRGLAAAGLLVVLAAGACSSDGGGTDNTGSAAQPPAVAGGDAAGGDAGARDQDAPQKAQSGAGGADLRVDQRAIIYTGTLQVRVDDVERAAREASTAVTAAGGFVGGDQRNSDSADARAELTLRVPAARFTTVLEALTRLGEQERREVRTEDVTEETVDLDARIATQRARVDSARRLLARATSITDLVTLENEVGRREADLASLEAKKRRLDDLTALSTITVTFLGPEAAAVEEEDLGFLTGLRGGWSAFLGTLQVALTVLGAVLPFVVAIGVPVGLVLALARRRGRRTPPGAPAAPDGPVPSGPPPVPAARSGP